jgi:NAD(P)-dependent dehydrogenase (short-subunit alcohol dehydrogenase family)
MSITASTCWSAASVPSGFAWRRFLGISDDQFERATQLNFFAAVRAAGAALGPMVDQGEGAIVNTASANAFFQPDAE